MSSVRLRCAQSIFLFALSSIGYADMATRSHSWGEGSCPWLLGAFTRPPQGALKRWLGLGAPNSDAKYLPAHDAMLTGVTRDPDDHTGYAAYGDFLAENGWLEAGEFVSTQRELAWLQEFEPWNERVPILEARERELSKRHLREWIPHQLARLVEGVTFRDGVPAALYLPLLHTNEGAWEAVMQHFPTVRHIVLTRIALSRILRQVADEPMNRQDDLPEGGQYDLPARDGRYSSYEVRGLHYHAADGAFGVYLHLPGSHSGIRRLRLDKTEWELMPPAYTVTSSLKSLELVDQYTFLGQEPPETRYQFRRALSQLEEFEFSGMDEPYDWEGNCAFQYGFLGNLGRPGPDFHFRRLYLHGSRYGGPRPRLPSMFHRDQLEVLDLRDNNIRDFGALGLFDSAWPRLERLSVAGNPLGDAFLVDLMRNRELFSHLKFLNLAQTSITEKGLQTFLSAMRGSAIRQILVSPKMRVTGNATDHVLLVYYHYREARVRRTPITGYYVGSGPLWAPAILIALGD